MSVLFSLHRGRALLGATVVLFVLVLPALVGVGPAARHHTTVTAPNVPSATAAPSHPSWLGLGLAAGGALLLGMAVGGASVVVVRRRAPRFAC